MENLEDLRNSMFSPRFLKLQILHENKKLFLSHQTKQKLELQKCEKKY